jgi:hypothetical protein
MSPFSWVRNARTQMLRQRGGTVGELRRCAGAAAAASHLLWTRAFRIRDGLEESGRQEGEAELVPATGPAYDLRPFFFPRAISPPRCCMNLEKCNNHKREFPQPHASDHKIEFWRPRQPRRRRW